MSGGVASPYAADALAANQAGQLTDQQRQALRGRDRAFRKNELFGAAGAAIVGVLLISSTGPSSNAAFRPLAALAAFALAVVLLARALLVRDSLSSDLAAGSVEKVEGAVLRESRSGRQTEFFYLQVSGHRFEVSRGIYDAAPEAGYVRVYYLPRSKTVVNLERLANPAPPAGALESPETLARTAIAALGSHDPNARAEAMAEMASYQAATAAPPPPAGARDPRPLAEAVIGSWHSGAVRVTFSTDGTMSTTLPGGHDVAGRWSIDPQGQFHAQIGGEDHTGQAWVSGSTLTVKEGDEGLSFQRG
jgi:hypothetical protein